MKSRKQKTKKVRWEEKLLIAPFKIEKHGLNAYRGTIQYPMVQGLDLKQNQYNLLLVMDKISGIVFIISSEDLVPYFEKILSKQREIASRIIDKVKAEAKLIGNADFGPRI